MELSRMKVRVRSVHISYSRARALSHMNESRLSCAQPVVEAGGLYWGSGTNGSKRLLSHACDLGTRASL
jgi:hypothetical protein